MEPDGIKEAVYAVLKSKTFIASVTGVIAFFAGHFVAVYRDKRKEFNVAADRLAGILNRSRAGEIALVDFDDFSRFLSGGTLRKYQAALKRYTEASQKRRDFDGTCDLRIQEPEMVDPKEAESRLRELKSFTKRR